MPKTPTRPKGPTPAPKTIETLADLRPDEKNANKGTQRGGALIENSLRNYGAGRSVVVDRDGNILGGNHVVEGCAAIGMDDVIVVPSDGSKLVVVQRTDLTIDDPRARELAVADNRTNQVNLAWDAAQLAELSQQGVAIENFWRPEEIDKLLQSVPPPFAGPENSANETPGAAGARADSPAANAETQSADADASQSLPAAHVRMAQLFFNGTQHAEFMQLIEALADHFGTANLTDTAFAAVQYAYHRLIAQTA